MSPLPRGERDLPCSLSASKHCLQGQECGRREPCCPIWGWLGAGPGFQSQLSCPVAVGLWAGVLVLASLSLVFNISMLGLLGVPANSGCPEAKVQLHVAAKGPVTEQRWRGSPRRTTVLGSGYFPRAYCAPSRTLGAFNSILCLPVGPPLGRHRVWGHLPRHALYSSHSLSQRGHPACS